MAKARRAKLSEEARQAHLSTDSHAGFEGEQDGERQRQKEQQEKIWKFAKSLLPISLVLHVPILAYILWDDCLPARYSAWSMISVPWDLGAGEWYKVMPRLTVSDLSWAISLLQQSAFYSALAWSAQSPAPSSTESRAEMTSGLPTVAIRYMRSPEMSSRFS